MEGKGKLSIAEIAALCNVSKATVSRVINNNPKGVGEETRKRVLEAIEKLNYRPNALARSIATARSGMVGLVVPDVSNFFYPAVIRGVMDCMENRGGSVLIANSDYDPKKEAEALLRMIDRRVDGIILCSGASNAEFLKEFKKYSVPVALMGRSFDLALSDVSISGDNVKGGYKSAKYLLDGGCRRIAYLEGKFSTSGGTQRLEGYRRAHAEAGIEVDESLLMEGDYTIGFGREAAHRIAERRNEIDAVMTGSDLVAIGLTLELLSCGIRVPEDIEVIGYDDIELASVFHPALSTISKPHYDMARVITKQLMKIVEGEKVRLPHMTVEPELILRETTRKRNG
ncbi:MAG: LacI family transcriptional regulator [Clostridiales bacterium]|nr:LacI family transcriptional regulator [Clostridiales bacterium]